MLLCFARFLLDHVRKRKKVPMRKVKMQAKTTPATAPEFNDDEELVLLFCEDKGASEDVGGDKVDEDDRDTDDPGDLEEVGVEVEVGGDDIREEDEVCEGLIVLVIKVVVVFSEMLDRLLGREVVECERVVVERSERVSKTVTVVGVVSPVISSLTYSSNCLTAISFTISAKKN